MKKLFLIELIVFLFFLSFKINAEEFDAYTRKTEEGLMVSCIYEGRGPNVYSVLNRNVSDLTEEEKISLCADKINVAQDGGAGLDFLITTELFKKHYHDMFNEFPTTLAEGKRIHYLGELRKLSESMYIMADETGQIRPFFYDDHEITDFSFLADQNYYYYLCDYKFYDNRLTIDIGVLTFPEYENDQQKNSLNKQFYDYCCSSMIFEKYEIDGKIYNDIEPRTIDNSYHEMNYFDDSVDGSIWTNYSDLFTIYSMNYQKDEQGEWHWISCTLSNPETSDGSFWPYHDAVIICLFIPIILLLIIIYNKTKDPQTVEIA